MSLRFSYRRRALAALALFSALTAFHPHSASAAAWQMVRDAPRVQRYTPFVDVSRHRLYLFTNFGLQGAEVWSVSLDPPSKWRLESAPNAAFREQATVVPDPAHDRVLAFGGTQIYSEHRTFDLLSFDLSTPGEWRQLSFGENGPLHGNSGAAVLDTRRNRLVAFGGEFTHLGATSATRRTWAFGSLARWDDLLTNEPPEARGWASAAYDSVEDRMVVTGGSAGLASSFTDTWELRFPANEWRRLPATGDAPPSATAAASWFSKSTRTLWYYEPAKLWSLDLSRTDVAAWTAREIPSQSRPLHGQPVWDDATQSLWQFDHVTGDLWRLSTEGTPTWSNAMDVPALPPARGVGRNVVFDPTTDRTFVLFGWDPSFGWLAPTGAEVSATSLRDWTPIAVTAPPRQGATAVMDEVNQRILVYGGQQNFGDVFSDLWEFRTVTDTWNQLSPTGDGPGPSSGHSAVIDPAGRRMILFGGTRMWELSLDGPPHWTRLEDAPVHLWNRQVVWDATRDRMVVVSAPANTTDDALPEVWTWSPGETPGWNAADTYGTVAAEPPYDVIPDLPHDRLILLGGSNRHRYPIVSWQLDLSTMTWRRYVTSDEPVEAYGPRSGYVDHVRGRAVLLNGGSYGPMEVWTLSLGDPVGAIARPISGAVVGSHVEVSWRLGGDALPLRLVIEQERAGTRTLAIAREGDIARYVDTRMVPNDTVTYTLQSLENGDVWTSLNTVRVHVPNGIVPPFDLALAPATMSVGSRMRIRLTLPDEQSARLEVFDVTGRRLADQDIGQNGPGEYTIYLEGDFRAGMYLVRLTHPLRVLHGRLVVLR